MQTERKKSHKNTWVIKKTEARDEALDQVGMVHDATVPCVLEQDVVGPGATPPGQVG